MTGINELLGNASSVAIAGHIGPDGDCVGSCMGMYLYLKKNRPDLHVDIYLESVREIFDYISCVDEVKNQADPEIVYDCFLVLDTSSPDRIGVAGKYLDTARNVVSIDHHITNKGFAEKNVIEANASSAREVVCGLLDAEKIDKDTATALYTGIIHDSGVLQYSNTSPDTLRTVAMLIDKGIPFSEIIDRSFYEKTFAQNRIMGKVLETARLHLGGQVIVGAVYPEDLTYYGVDKKDTDGIVSQLRLTKDVKAAVFLYPLEDGAFKVSLRANGNTDVSKVASAFGGGGHIKAAGCTLYGSAGEVTEKLLEELAKELG